MATSATDNIKESVTIQKDILIRDFSQENAMPNSAIFYHKDTTEPFCKVFVNPVCRSNPEFVSVRVRRCSFYPRFLPGVVYRSLGWTVSVVDADGAEKFVSYFGHEDFQSLDWVEDFFSDRGYELQEFVKRSALSVDPERFLPDDVLTVRVVMFYESRTADEAVAMETCGEEIQAFIVKPFLEQQVSFAEKRQDNLPADLNSNAEESKKTEKNAEDSKKSTELEHVFQELALEGNKFHGKEGYWRKEIVLMMAETLQELKEAFELYAKLQQLKDIVERTPQPLDSQDIDYCPDLFQDMDLFRGLFTEVGLGPPMERDFLSWMEEPFGVVEVTHQLGRILAVHKHLQTHWEKCKGVYKRAAEKQLEQSSEDGMQGAHKCTIGEGIRELFLIYVKTVKENEPDRLLIWVSRFVKVSSNVIRILSLRLYWPVCVLQQSPPPPPFTTLDDQDRTMSEKDDDKIDEKSSFSSGRVTGEDKHIEKFEQTSSTEQTDLKAPESDGEMWYFTIETSDRKRFEIPFRTGTTTLGSLLRSASSVFDRMLETPMTEKSSRFLKVDDFESSTFSRFLSYLENGKVDVDTSLQECFELYQLAHKYQAEKLVLDCVGKIAQIMDHTEAEDVAEFSKFYGDDKLRSMVEAFRFRPRATMAAWGLTYLDVHPLSRDTTCAKSVKDVPIVEKAIQAVRPEEKYEFYE